MNSQQTVKRRPRNPTEASWNNFNQTDGSLINEMLLFCLTGINIEVKLTNCWVKDLDVHTSWWGKDGNTWTWGILSQETNDCFRIYWLDFQPRSPENDSSQLCDTRAQTTVWLAIQKTNKCWKQKQTIGKTTKYRKHDRTENKCVWNHIKINILKYYKLQCTFPNL